MPDVVIAFRGAYECLSNFSDHDTWYDGRLYPTAENAYQAAKSVWPDVRDHLMTLTPSEAKKYGRTTVLRPDWDDMKNDVMLAVLRDKFRRNPKAAFILRETGRMTLVEGNTWHDNYWGDCLCESCINSGGVNMLGKLLMQVRDELGGHDGP